MGVRYPLNREQLIKQHTQKMRQYADDLLGELWPFVSRRKVAERIIKCAREIDAAHLRIIERERQLDRDQ